MTSVPAKTSDFDYDTGLEQFGVEDAVIPRLSIVHKDGQFKDSLTNAQFTTIKVIILGLVKQRVLFHPVVDDGDWPMCKSADHDTGFPNMSDEQPKEKRFALLWDKAGFDPKDFPPDENGVIRLPCDSCQLKEWGTHPDGKKPYCAEQFTLPILYDPDEDGSLGSGHHHLPEDGAQAPQGLPVVVRPFEERCFHGDHRDRAGHAEARRQRVLGAELQEGGQHRRRELAGVLIELPFDGRLPPRRSGSSCRGRGDFSSHHLVREWRRRSMTSPMSSTVRSVEGQKSAVAAPVPDDNDDLPF